ncbi:MAG: dihydroorotase [Bacteroidetes bacterium]|nr:dihydroorotase [Bacteroidota bacterium]MDA0943361.1 dihydroorotase [Bacteroidota bacterium]
MSKTIIHNALLVNEGKKVETDILIDKGRIEKIGNQISENGSCVHVDLNGDYLLPGVIDDQVHFREPGLTHKAQIATESRAALKGGVTSFMEMPNVIPQTVSLEALEEKYARGAVDSAVNYSFYLGATNENIEEVKRVSREDVCGVKIFMGSSTGNMLVDKPAALEAIFSNSPTLVAVHCECEDRVKERTQAALDAFGLQVPASQHAVIRDDLACYLSSSQAVELAKKHGTRLHILHLTSALELDLFRNDIPLREKRITAEVCVHHLHFSDADYERLGFLIKCNPAIKKESDRLALWMALLDNRLDVIATDHAPHTWEEKNTLDYTKAPSGLPLVQHSLPLMLEHAKKGDITMERVVEKMSHAVADCYRMVDRGYVREGYWADLVQVSSSSNTVNRADLAYKCTWSPLEGQEFSHSIERVWVNGHLGFQDGQIDPHVRGQRLMFEARR